jgi:hypothetical protein
MEQYSLFAVCNIAYTTCFVVLGVLALFMRAITAIFPGSTVKVDAALVAAISSTVAAIIPDAQVTKIEEES